MVKAIIFDFSRTLYDPDAKSLEPGALAVLKYLSKKYPLGLLSKKGDGNRDGLFESLGIRGYFKAVIIVEEKSAGSFFDCANLLGIPTAETLAVGDQVKKDVALAKQAGCATAWLCKGKFAVVLPESVEETPDYTIEKLEEILEIA